MEVKEYVNNGTHWLLPPREILQLPEGSHSFPAFFIWSLIFCSETVHLPFSCLTGVVALYIMYIWVCSWEGMISVPPMSLPFWTSLFIFNICYLSSLIWQVNVLDLSPVLFLFRFFPLLGGSNQPITLMQLSHWLGVGRFLYYRKLGDFSIIEKHRHTELTDHLCNVVWC